MWWRRSREDDLQQEIRSHLDMAERDLQDRGRSASSARTDARREFGNVLHVLEAVRDARRRIWMADLRQDVTYAMRGWRRSPLVTAIAILTLGTAIGLGTSVFTGVNTLFLATWPVHEPARLAQLRTVNMEEADYRRLASITQTFSSIAAVACTHCRARVQDRDLRVHLVSPNFFNVLGVPFESGHGFPLPDSSAAAPMPVVVLSHSFWRTALAADPAVLGTSVRVNGVPLQVIGVVARRFTGTTIDDAPALWVPLSTGAVLGLPPETMGIARLIGRFNEGVTRESAQAEMNVLLAAGAEAADPRRRPPTLQAATYVPLSKLEEAGALGLMGIAVLLMLLLACANVGNLLLARAASRTGETATRLSLGASRGRLVRQFLTESLTLALAACALGVALAFVLPGVVMNGIDAASPRPLDLAVPFMPDLRVMLFACGLAALSVFAFGLAPALLASRQDAVSALKVQGLTLTARLGPRRFLLAVQVAVSTVLLVCAGLIARSVSAAASVDLGFDVEGVAEAGIRLPSSMPATLRQSLVEAFFDDAAQVDPDAVAVWGQRFGYAAGAQVSLPEAPDLPPLRAVRFDVTPSLFAVLDIEVIGGRTLDAARADGIVISETLATRLWPDRSAVGRVVRVGETLREIVGVVRDADLMGVSLRGEFTSSRPAVYQRLSTASAGARVLVRRDRPEHAEALRRLAGTLHPEAALEITPLADTRDQRMADSRVAAALAGLLGTAALAMATVGLGGVFGYVARQRRREVGIHVALGARPSAILRRVFAPSLRALALGMGAGFMGGAAAASLLSGYVHPGIGAFDAAAHAGAGLVLGAAALAAIAIPARAASRVDPVAALRSE
jgi:predicted permease